MKYKKQILIGLAFLIVFPVYFYYFFQNGIVINEIFLPRKQIQSKTQYNGGGISIIAAIDENTAQITFTRGKTVKNYEIESNDSKDYYNLRKQN